MHIVKNRQEYNLKSANEIVCYSVAMLNKQLLTFVAYSKILAGRLAESAILHVTLWSYNSNYSLISV